MKFNKILCLIFALLMVVSLAACGGDSGNEDPDIVVGKVMEIEDCVAKITDVKLVKDVDDKDAIAMSFDFTNNSDEAKSFYWTVYNIFTQNDTELEMTLVYLDEENFIFMDDGTSEDIEPGATKSVTITYGLIDTVTPVEIEFSDLTEDNVYNVKVDIANLK